MRITNNMITSNTKNNINGNKTLVDKYNTQMTTQKKISKASDDPVIAIRSLRLSTSLTQLDQYVDNNIPDASSWLDVTYTALNNMMSLITDARTNCVNAATDTLSTSDRQTLLQSLQSISEQIYSEGNSDYAGRTVFTGYRTNSKLTFEEDEADTSYDIEQNFTYEDLNTKSYYAGQVTVPSDASAECDSSIEKTEYTRLRVAYDDITDISNMSYSYTTTDASGNEVTETEQFVFADLETVKSGKAIAGASSVATKCVVYDTEADWAASDYHKTEGAKEVGDDDVIFIKQTGEFIFGKNVANDITSTKATLTTNYEKTGFEAGELRPEYYYNCTDTTNEDDPITYTKEDQAINYTIANSTKLTINTQASDVFDSSILRDINEMINVVQASVDADAKVTKIKSMMSESQYEDEESQAKLQTWLDQAQKEADYAQDNLQSTFEGLIGNFDDYLTSVNTAITNVGSTQSRLEMVQSRVENQQDNIQSLKSQNEDRDISDIIIDYYASYNAYQASLTAASKVSSQTLLNYL